MSSVRELKGSADPLDAFDLEGDERHLLRCAYPDDPALRSGDARFFAELRAQNADAFFDLRTPDEATALRWVETVYAKDDSQLNFIISNSAGDRLGFFGLTSINEADGSAEFGRVMRQRGGPAGLTSAAMDALFRWAGEALSLRRFRLEVFADNDRAIRLYERSGFERTGSHRRIEQRTGGYTAWVEGERAGSREVIEMELRPESD